MHVRSRIRAQAQKDFFFIHIDVDEKWLRREELEKREGILSDIKSEQLKKIFTIHFLFRCHQSLLRQGKKAIYLCIPLRPSSYFRSFFFTGE
jgi:hypothetical protein